MRPPFKIRRRHQSKIAIAGVIFTLTALSIPNILNNSSRWSRLTEAIQRESELTDHLKISQEALTERSKIADTRLQGGCNVIPMVWDQPNKATVIAEGVRIKNPDNNVPFPPGTIACDPWGNTGEVAQSTDGETIVTNVASTTNFDLVREAMAKHGLVMGAGNPNVGASAGRAKH